MARRSHALALFLMALSTLVLSSCSLGPKYSAPTAPIPPAYKETGGANLEGDWKPAQPNDAASRGKWWKRLNDPQLNVLEDKLNISNQNIAAAAAGVLEARATIRASRAQYFPTVTVNPGITNSLLSNAFGQNVGINYTTFAAPLEASWEPDLWRRIRNTVKSNTF